MSTGSSNGENLLNQGAMNAGHAQVMTIISTSHRPQAHSHQSVAARSIRLSTTTITGPPSNNINTALLI